MNRRRKKYTDYQENNDAIIVETKIVSIPEIIEYSETRVKTVFDCESSSETPRKCIYWGRINIDKGDHITMKGRLNNEVFIAWGMMINKKGESANEERKDEAIS